MPATPPPSAADAVRQTIRARRSLKPNAMDTDRPVPDALLSAILEDATWAPSHGMTEPWHFEIYRGAARSRLAGTLQNLYDRATPAAEIRPEKRKKLGENPLLAPALVLIVCRPGANPKVPVLEEIEAVACAVQNLHLSATAAGLGGFWSSPQCLGDEAAPAALGLQPDDRPLGIFYLGWPKEGFPPAPKRTPWEEKAVFHG